MKLIYRTSVIATGGNKGRVQSQNGNIKFALSDSKALTTEMLSSCAAPEELLAAAISAYFTRSVKNIMKEKGLKLKQALSVNTQLELLQANDSACYTQITLDCFLSDLSEEMAFVVLNQALSQCPVLSALDKGIQVKLNLIRDNEKAILY